MGVKTPLCTRCNRPNNRGGRTRICLKCFQQSPRKSVRLLEAPPSKVCAFCREEKPKEEFFKNAARADWLSVYCKPCHRTKEKRRYDSDKDRGKDYRLWSRYNISLEEYNDMLVSQDYKCALCPKKHTIAKPLHVDHSHEEPSIVRGLLCNLCNQRKLGSLTLSEVEMIHAYLVTPPAISVVGQRLVPLGMEKGRPSKRKRKYKHYKKEA